MVGGAASGPEFELAVRAQAGVAGPWGRVGLQPREMERARGVNLAVLRAATSRSLFNLWKHRRVQWPLVVMLLSRYFLATVFLL